MAYSGLGRNPTIISHNVRGLNIPEKRSSLLRELKKGRPSFVFLQETHFQTNHIPNLTDRYFTEAHHATHNTSKSKGVSILISKDAKFDITDKLVDPEGRFIFLKGSCHGNIITLANVYFPNSGQIIFCQKMVAALTNFLAGKVILGGDFNVPLNPSEDTSTGKTYLTYKILKKIKSLINSLSLIDSWRFLHPEDRDYTFYSIPHNRHARIDFLFISQKGP